MTYLERAKDFQGMQAQGQTMECFEKYYADDCKVYEMPTGQVREGKDAQRKAIHEWFEMVEEMHQGGCDAITANEETATTMTETWFDVTFKGGSRTMMKEVGVQKWRGDQIIEEKFYYNAPPQQS